MSPEPQRVLDHATARYGRVGAPPFFISDKRAAATSATIMTRWPPTPTSSQQVTSQRHRPPRAYGHTLLPVIGAAALHHLHHSPATAATKRTS